MGLSVAWTRCAAHLKLRNAFGNHVIRVGDMGACSYSDWEAPPAPAFLSSIGRIPLLAVRGNTSPVLRITDQTNSTLAATAILQSLHIPIPQALESEQVQERYGLVSHNIYR